MIPDGLLVAMPTQNRVDSAKGQFQVKIINGSDERFTVVGVQFVWDGYTTPVTERHDIVVSGQRIDFPVKFPGATCVGDRTLASMPDLASATVRLILDDGSERIVPVFDVDHTARRLYLEDCERQMIDSMVAIEWVDLHAVEFEGRPVTEGVLAADAASLDCDGERDEVSNNVLFVFVAPDAPPDGPIVTLDAGDDEGSALIRFVESRCDPHAISEASQPFKFVAQVDLGGGEVHPYIVPVPRSTTRSRCARRWRPVRGVGRGRVRRRGMSARSIGSPSGRLIVRAPGRCTRDVTDDRDGAAVRKPESVPIKFRIGTLRSMTVSGVRSRLPIAHLPTVVLPGAVVTIPLATDELRRAVEAADGGPLLLTGGDEHELGVLARVPDTGSLPTGEPVAIVQVEKTTCRVIVHRPRRSRRRRRRTRASTRSSPLALGRGTWAPSCAPTSS